MSNSSTSLWKLAFRMAGWFAVILFWELLTMPAVRPSNSWQGVWISIALLPLSSYRLSRSNLRTSWFFVFGFSGALLFVPRFLHMDRFGLWLQYQAPSDHIIILWFLCIALGLGALCWGSAQLRRSVRDDDSEQLTTAATAQPVVAAESAETTDRLRLQHLFLWIGCIAMHLGIVRVLSTSSEFLSYQIAWPFLVVTVLSSIGAGTALFGIVLFVGRSLRNIEFPRYVGEFLWLALGIRSVFWPIAQGPLMLLSGPETITPSVDAYRALTAAGVLVAAMLLIVPLRQASFPWRVFLICFIAVSLMSCFESSFIMWRFGIAYSVLRILPSLVLVGVIVHGFSKRVRFPWTHWLGVVNQLWFSLVYLIWLVWSTWGVR